MSLIPVDPSLINAEPFAPSTRTPEEVIKTGANETAHAGLSVLHLETANSGGLKKKIPHLTVSDRNGQAQRRCQEKKRDVTMSGAPRTDETEFI